MSGHSKWSNIKHRKGAQDAARGKIFTRIGKEIVIAVREGGPDINSNPRLKTVVTKAKTNNMPNDTIEKAIKKASSDKESNLFEYITYEGYGPCGVAVLVDCLTDNKNRSVANVRHVFTKIGGNLGTAGCVSYLFEKKGQILIEKTDQIREDDLMMLVLDAGAEDFAVDEEGYEVSVPEEAFNNVVSKLDESKIQYVEAEIKMVPKTVVEITDETDLEKMDKMLQMLDDDDDVQEVWHNMAER